MDFLPISSFSFAFKLWLCLTEVDWAFFYPNDPLDMPGHYPVCPCITHICPFELTLLFMGRFWKEEQNVFPQINSKTHNLRIIFLIFIWSDSFFLINHRGIKASSKYHIQIFISLHKLRNQCLRKNWKYWFFMNFRNIFE